MKTIKSKVEKILRTEKFVYIIFESGNCIRIKCSDSDIKYLKANKNYKGE